MPASIFSETELARLASFPEEIPGDDLIRAFTLTGADRDLVAIRRGAANRLGLALQLCALRYLGFVARNLSAAPRSAACLRRSCRTHITVYGSSSSGGVGETMFSGTPEQSTREKPRFRRWWPTNNSGGTVSEPSNC